MKSFIYSFFAMLVLTFTTSCQKEDIMPENSASTALYGQTIGPGNGQGPSSAAFTTISTGTATTWENWDLCGKPFIASKKLLPSKQWALTVYDANMNQNFYAQSVAFSQLPNPVIQTLELMFPSQVPTAQWQTMQPFNGPYFVEYNQGGYVAIAMVDASGNVLCKGTHP